MNGKAVSFQKPCHFVSESKCPNYLILVSGQLKRSFYKKRLLILFGSQFSHAQLWIFHFFVFRIPCAVLRAPSSTTQPLRSSALQRLIKFSRTPCRTRRAAIADLIGSRGTQKNRPLWPVARPITHHPHRALSLPTESTGCFDSSTTRASFLTSLP